MTFRSELIDEVSKPKAITSASPCPKSTTVGIRDADATERI